MGLAFTPRHVLVTRPEPGLFATMAEVTAQGWHALASPALLIEHNKPSTHLLSESFRAIAITSAQSISFLGEVPKDTLLFTVGKKTAERALRAGFTNVCAANGNSKSLITLCQEHQIYGRDLILASGTGWNGSVYGADIIEHLGAKRYESYKVKRNTRLNRVIGHSLLEKHVDAVLFYSSETVAAFMALCSAEHRQALKGCRALCLSDAIAQKARSLADWREVGLVRDLGSYQILEEERACILKSFMPQEERPEVPRSMAQLPCYMQGGGDCKIRGCLGFLQDIYS